MQRAPPSRAPWLAALARKETATEGLAKLQVLGDYDPMDRTLDADRIDVAIDTRVNRARIVKRLGHTGIQRVGELVRLDLFNILAPAKSRAAP